MVLCTEYGLIDYARWYDTIYNWDLNPKLENSISCIWPWCFLKNFIPAPVSNNCCTPVIKAEIQSVQAKSQVDILDDPLRKMKVQSIPPLGYRVFLILCSSQ